MNRETVYKVIDGERDYQNEMTARADRPDMIEDFRVSDGLNAIRYNLSKAGEAWYKGCDDHQEAMEYIRKIAGICVNLGERYGMPTRKTSR